MRLIRRTGICGAGLLALLWAMPAPQVLAASNSAVPASGAGAYVKLIVAFIVVLLLLVLLFRFLGRRVGVVQRGSIDVLAARQLAPNRSVQVVEVGQKRYLLGVGENVQLLADVTDSYTAASEVGTPGSFGGTLQQVLAELRRDSRRNDEP